MRTRLPLVSFALIAVVCGCSKHDPVADDLKPMNVGLPVNRVIQFYESRAVPASGVQTAKQSMNGTFRFTGEGQAWEKFEALQRNGDKLMRTETNPAASYTYAKC